MQTGGIETGPHGLRWFCDLMGSGNAPTMDCFRILGVAFGTIRARHIALHAILLLGTTIHDWEVA